MRLTDPILELTFLGADLEPGHDTFQIVRYDKIINRSVKPVSQLLSGLKSSSNQIKLNLSRSCPATEDIIATSGDVKAVLKDGESTLFTGYLSTNYSWNVTKNGEQILQITLEDVGTRLFKRPFIETGKHFFSGTASSAIQAICASLDVIVRPGDVDTLTQEIAHTAEAGQTCKDLLDQLLYECNAVYFFNNVGQLCIHRITADTSYARRVDSSELCDNGGQVVSLSKSIRTYKGARVLYDEISTADDYLVYRNTTGQDADHPYCNLPLEAGEWFDGTEIYTAQEWSEATADEFREPALIGAVNAASESSIVGSNAIINISDLSPSVDATYGTSCTFENVGGGYFKVTAHNGTHSPGSFSRMDLYASIVYIKARGVVRTTIDGASTGKTLLEESMSWIHDKEGAQRHANLLAQYHRNSGAVYTFHTASEIPLGSVIQLVDDVYTGLNVNVLVYYAEDSQTSGLVTYKGAAITTFDLEQDVYHGVTEPAKPSAAQGPAGVSAEIQYALGSSLVTPPVADMLWNGEPMTWGGEAMQWGEAIWSEDVPDMVRGLYIWMRSRIGSADWQYTRITGSVAWDAEGLGVFTSACPTQSKQGLGLIPGDYFIAGATFTDSGVEYHKGYAYTYNGAGWDVLDLSQAVNYEKALDCLGALMTSGINVTDSTASIYGWFHNLVVQNGVIANLVAGNIQVGDGTGEAGSGFRFRAREYDDNGQKLTNPDFDVYYGDSKLFDVDSDGKIFFGSGFWYDPSDGAIHSANDGIVINSSGYLTVNSGMYMSDLVCPSFRSLPRNTPTTTITVQPQSSAKALVATLRTAGIGSLSPCVASNYPSVAYIHYSHSGYTYSYSFSDSNMNTVVYAYWNTRTGDSYWSQDMSSTTLTIGTSSTVSFKLLNKSGSISIGSSTSGLETGELYYTADGNGTGTLHVKL